MDGIRTPIDARPFTESRRSQNLDSLRTHRLSHAAETGQFVPRTRWSNSVPTQAPPIEQGDYFHSRLSSAREAMDTNPFATPGDVLTSRTPYVDASSQQDLRISKSEQQQAKPLLHQQQPDESMVNHQYTDFNHPSRQSRSARKVNSGFEVLPPGTFPMQEYNSTGMARSEDWDHDLEAGDRQPSRRLHKKRRDSASKASSFVEQI